MDGVRLRVGLWPGSGEPGGTVLLFPGRTEYLEKYGRVARDLVERGYSVASIDWRGQGLSDRLAEDARLGHVERFRDYQADVAALVEVVQDAALPEPRFLLAHSMGACIGLRAVLNGLAVTRAVFSAPMWGIHVPPLKRPAAALLPDLARMTGRRLRVVPGARASSHISDTPFEENPLTTDPDHYAFMQRQVAAHPEFALGGPTYQWFAEARREIRSLRRASRPKLPVLTMIGTDEEIVDPSAVMAMHRDWPQARLEIIQGARHEPMMEAPALRGRFMRSMFAFLGGNN